MPGLGAKSGTAFRQDLLINRPVAEPSLEGFFFFALDDNLGTLYQCNGTTWVPITGGLRGLVAGPGISLINTPSTITINNAYSLPIATSSILGGIKVGSVLSIDGGGILSVPIASPSVLGVIRVGDGLVIDGDGILSVIDLPVQHNGTLVADRHILNLIDGANVSMSIVDDAINDRVSVTVNASGGGGGSGNMDWLGTWSNTSVYSVDDVTIDGGKSYICIAPVALPPDYYATVLADTPTAYWPLTESGTSIGSTYADTTGNGHNVHVVNGTLSHVPGPLGNGDTAVSMPDTPSWDMLEGTNLTGFPSDAQPLTMEGWLYSRKDNFWSQWISYKVTGAGPFEGSDHRNNTGGGYTELEFWNPGNGGTVFNVTPILHNAWHYIVVTDDGAGTLRFYIDGTLVNTQTGAGTSGVASGTTGKIDLGDNNSTSLSLEGYFGYLSNMAIYNHVLTGSQVLNHWNVANSGGGNPNPEADPTHWTLLDAESVQHAGTLIGTRPVLNLIDGSNISLTVADNPGNSSVDVTISGSGSGGLSLYQSVVMADSPIGFWPLTEQGTIVGAIYADISGNARNVQVKVGTLTHVEGITTGTTAPYLGDPTGTGTSDALWTNNTVGLPVTTQAYTLEGWIKPSPSRDFDYELGPGSNIAWMAYGKPNFGGVIIGSDFRTSEWTSGASDNRLRLNGQSNASSSTTAALHAPLGTGTWHHVVVSDDAAGRVKVYVDGYLVLNFGAAGTNNGLVYDIANVLFFGDPGLLSGSFPAPLASEFAGAISHYAIYNHVLTDAQVLNHFMVAKNTSQSPDLVPNVMAYAGNLNTTIPSNSNISVNLVHTHWDNGSPTPQHDNSVNPSRITCTEDGLYKISGRLNWLSGTYDGFFTIRVFKNRTGTGFPSAGTVAENSLYINGNPSNSIVQYVSGEVRLAIGDYVELIASQLSNSSVDRFLNSADSETFDYTQSRLHMFRIG